MGFWRGLTRGRIREDRGAYAILFAILIVAIFSMVAVVVDLGANRAGVRQNRQYVDLAVLSGALNLPNGQAACNTSWNFLVLNGAIPVGTASPCGGLSATCNATTPVSQSVYYPSAASPIFTFTFPVLDTDPAMRIQYGNTTNGSRGSIDGAPCERMALTMRTAVSTLFGGIFGSGKLSSPATAVVRRTPGFQSVPVALLLLEPHGCNVLQTQGNGVQVFVHASPPDATNVANSGRITVDSDGTDPGSSCAGGKVVVNANGSTPDRIEAFNSCDGASCSGGFAGAIEIYAIQPPSTTCTASNKACLTSQIFPNTAMIDAQTTIPGFGVPESLQSRVTRAPFDHTFNCKSIYANYLGDPTVPIAPCTDAKPPYIDNLQTAIDGTPNNAVPPVFPNPTTAPATGTWITIGNGGVGALGPSACTETANVTYPPGNYWVNCTGGPTKGFNVTSGITTFQGGNIVFQGNVDVTSTLKINDCTGGVCPATLTCLSTSCTGGEVNQFSQNAAFMYLRNDSHCGGAGCSLTVSGGSGELDAMNVMTFIKSGVYNMGGGIQGAHVVAPQEGPFKNLGLWSDNLDSSSVQNLAGQAGLNLQGVFFAPQSQISYTGQGCTAQLSAQFVSRTLSVGGNSTACLNMRPTPGGTVLIPLFGPLLIR